MENPSNSLALWGPDVFFSPKSLPRGPHHPPLPCQDTSSTALHLPGCCPAAAQLGEDRDW